MTHAGLTPAQRRSMVAAIAVLHGAGVWALLQVREVREAVAQAAPMFVQLIAPEPVRAKPPEPVPPRIVPPVKRPPPPPMVTAAPSPAPVAPLVAPPPAEPVPAPAPPVPVAQAPAPVAPPVVTPPQPKTIPASAVQYLTRPDPVYPALSRRQGEEGAVVVRVFVDEAGLPHEVQVVQSSGHRRLDDTWVAAVQKARFRPYMENGRALAVWTTASTLFELEK